MQSVRYNDDFLRDPIGRCFVGPNFAIWCWSPELCGTISWGALRDADAIAIAELLDFVRHPMMAHRYDVLMDTRAVERVDGEALLRFGDAIKDRLPEWSERIRRQAVVIPEGVAGVLLAGLVTSLDSTFPVRFVANLDDAFAHLDGTPACEAHADAQALVAQHRRVPPVIDRVRAQVARDPANATLSSVAQALGSAPRSLQRELQAAQSSFSDELRRVRVEAAVELLQSGELALDGIAQRLGFGTTSRMNAALRRELGASASEIRARR